MIATKISAMMILVIFVSSCTSLSTRSTILRDMAIGAVAGSLIAQTRETNKDAYTSMYAGIGAATAGAISVYFNASHDDQLKNENQSLNQQINHFQKQLEPQLIQKGNSLFSSPLPKEVASLVEPGEWKRYKLDQWVQDQYQPNTWYRQVEMFEIIPPVAR